MKKTYAFLIVLVAVIGLSLRLIAGNVFTETLFFRDVDVATFDKVSGITNALTGFTNGLYTNGVITNFYRLNATNRAGRLPTSDVHRVIFTGNTNDTNAVVLTWDAKDGIGKYALEFSFDGSLFSNWIFVSVGATTYVDRGTGFPFTTFFTNDHTNIIPAPTVPWASLLDISGLNETQESHTAQIISNDLDIGILFSSNSVFDITISSLTETQSSQGFQISSNDDELAVLFSSNSTFDIAISSLTITQSSSTFQIQSNDDQISDILITNANQDFAIAALTATQSSQAVQITSNDQDIVDLTVSNNNLQVQANASTATNGQQDASLAQKINTNHAGNVTINGSIGFGQGPIFGAGVDMFAHSASTATGNLDVAWHAAEARGAANFAMHETIVRGEFNFGAGVSRVVELAKDSAAFGSASVGGFKNMGINDSKISGTNSFAAGGGVATGNVVVVLGNGRSTGFNNTFVYSGPEAAEATSNNQVTLSATNGMLFLGDNTIVVSNNFVPARSNFYSIGTVDRPWSEGFFGPDSLDIGGQSFTTTGGVYRVDGVEVQKADSEVIVNAITSITTTATSGPTGTVIRTGQVIDIVFPAPGGGGNGIEIFAQADNNALAQSITGGVVTKMDLKRIIEDNSNAVSLVTDDFVAPIDGWYTEIAGVEIDNKDASSSVIIFITTNNVIAVPGRMALASGTANVTTDSSKIASRTAFLLAGETMQAYIFSGTTESTTTSPTTFAQFLHIKRP